ncbi:unnamed protein product, partial [Prorocentrum cordatum]
GAAAEEGAAAAPPLASAAAPAREEGPAPPERAAWGAGLFPGVRPDLIPDAPIVDPGFVDEEALREQNRFPIPEEGLVQLAKGFVARLFSDPADVKRRMASDFRFVAPVVPALGDGLTGDQLTTALGQFSILDAVPDLNPQQYDFRTDPFEPNRVWFTSRGRGTMTGTLAGGLPATRRSFESPPQTSSLTFNAAGEVTKMTIGYVMDKDRGGWAPLAAWAVSSAFSTGSATGYPYPRLSRGARLCHTDC